MTNVQRLFLQCMARGICGGHVDWEQITPEDWRQLLALAQEQHVLPMVVEAAYPSAAFRALPGEFQTAARQQVRQMVFAQAQKNGALFEVLSGLAEAGVPVVVMKGAVCRSLYPIPEARSSADEDLLAGPGEFEAAAALLKGRGCSCTQKSDHESEFVTPEGLYIELHRLPFPGDSFPMQGANVHFETVFDGKYALEVPGGRIPAMPPHEHMLYLILHAFKHLIYRGFGLRQMCDILLWGEGYAAEIDWGRLEEQCAALRAWDFARAVFALGRNHLGVELPVDTAGMEEQGELLLEDVFAGGIFGGETLSRKHSAGITLNAVQAGQRGKKSSLLHTLFPARKALAGRYPWLEERPFLLPAAWMLRLLGYAAEQSREDSAAESLRIGRERTELLRKLNVID